MKKWSDIEKALGEQRVEEGMLDADSFAEDFQARAKLRSQEQSVPTPRVSYGWRWGLASACAALIVMVAGLRMVVLPGAEMTGTIKSIEVTAAHSAVMILDDENSDSTILWIVDMDAGDDNGDNT